MTKPVLRRKRSSAAPIIGVISLVAVFLLLAFVVSAGHSHSLDWAILQAFRDVAGQPAGPRWLREAIRDITALGSFAFLGLVTFVLTFYFVLIRKRSFALLLLATVIGGFIVNSTLKLVFDRQRPEGPSAAEMTTASFPSGHSAVSAITFLTLGAMLSRSTSNLHLRIYFLSVAVALAFLVGASRVYLGVHFPSDVLAGWLVAGAWALSCWTLASVLQREGEVEPPSSAV